jgi:hypothetical protein
MVVDNFVGMRNINITPRAPAAALAAAMHKAAVSNSSNTNSSNAASNISAHLGGGVRHPSPHNAHDHPTSSMQPSQQTIWRSLAPGPPPQFAPQNTNNSGVITGPQVPLLAPAPFPRPTSLVAPMDYRLAKDSSDDQQQQQGGNGGNGSGTNSSSGVTLGNSSSGPPLGPPKVSMATSSTAAPIKPSIGMPIANTGASSNNSNTNMRGDQFAPTGMMVDQTQRPPVRFDIVYKCISTISIACCALCMSKSVLLRVSGCCSS